MSEAVAALVVKGRRSPHAARRLHADEDYDFAVSRAYYAMFYLAQALLASEQAAFSKHTAVLAEFNRRYVATGRLDRRHYAALRDAFNARNVADYQPLPPPSAEQAQAMLEAADQFIDAVSRLLPPA